MNLAAGDDRLVLLVDDFVGLALSEEVVYIFDGLEPELAFVPGEVEVQLLRLEVGELHRGVLTKDLLR